MGTLTAHPSTASVPTSYCLMWHYNCLWALKGMLLPELDIYEMMLSACHCPSFLELSSVIGCCCSVGRPHELPAPFDGQRQYSHQVHTAPTATDSYGRVLTPCGSGKFDI